MSRKLIFALLAVSALWVAGTVGVTLYRFHQANLNIQSTAYRCALSRDCDIDPVGVDQAFRQIWLSSIFWAVIPTMVLWAAMQTLRRNRASA